jgi:metallo-beta-lactamase family protein
MMLKLSFHGAARTVTGSNYMIQTENARVLIDCGMFQGARTESELNYRAFPYDTKTITALVLTHAHIDHTGLVPKLVKHGFSGAIHASEGTRDLCAIMLPDSGFIQETEVKRLNERNAKRGLPEVEPIYTMDDALAALNQFTTHRMEEWFSPAAGIRMRYWNAGHLLGSCSIEVEVEQAGTKPTRLLFSGDIGPDNKLLEQDPEAPSTFDFVICESTYGGRDRFERQPEKRLALLAQEVTAAANRGGVMLIPSFAVERTQEVVTDLVTVMERGLAPKANIFIDSPLANKATAVFRKHAGELEGGAALARAFASPYVKSTESVDDSKALNRFGGFHIVIAASGMAEAGRIRHHLRNRLWQRSTTVLLVGFQAKGSLGSLLEEGAKQVTIMGDQIKVAATIRRIEDYSGHADGPELVQWIKERLPVGRSIFLTHGEEEGQVALAEDIRGLVPDDCIIRPRLDDVYDLSGAACALLSEETKPRIDPTSVAKLDWNNDLQSLILDIGEELKQATDAKSKSVIIRRLRRALAGEEGNQGAPPRTPAGRQGKPSSIDE